MPGYILHLTEEENIRKFVENMETKEIKYYSDEKKRSVS